MRKILFSKREREAGYRDPHSRASTPAELRGKMDDTEKLANCFVHGSVRDAEASSRREAGGLGKETGRAVLWTSTQTYKPQVPLWVLVRHSSGRLVNNGEKFHFFINSFIRLKRILGT